MAAATATTTLVLNDRLYARTARQIETSKCVDANGVAANRSGGGGFARRTVRFDDLCALAPGKVCRERQRGRQNTVTGLLFVLRVVCFFVLYYIFVLQSLVVLRAPNNEDNKTFRVSGLDYTANSLGSALLAN